MKVVLKSRRKILQGTENLRLLRRILPRLPIQSLKIDSDQLVKIALTNISFITFHTQIKNFFSGIDICAMQINNFYHYYYFIFVQWLLSTRELLIRRFQHHSHPAVAIQRSSSSEWISLETWELAL